MWLLNTKNVASVSTEELKSVQFTEFRLALLPMTEDFLLDSTALKELGERLIKKMKTKGRGI